MAVLDNLNVVPTYIFKLPSSGEEVKYRPFLHKEEKVLQMARETEDPKSLIRAIKDSIKACTFGEFDVDNAPSFDIEELFLRIRECSIGESVTVTLICQNQVERERSDGSIYKEPCHTGNDVKINLSKIKIDPKKIPTPKPIVKLSEEVSVEMRYPNIDTIEVIGLLRKDTNNVDVVDLLCTTIFSVFTKEEVYLAKEMPKGELKKFLENLTTQQVESLLNVLMSSPSIEYKISETCKKCGQKIDYTFKGIFDFFE